MEEWQRDWIVKKGLELLFRTEVNPKVLALLRSKNHLDDDDIYELERVSKYEGVAAQRSKFYQKLVTKTCYDDLIEVLAQNKQSGVVALLKEGKEENETLRRSLQNQLPETNDAHLFGKIPAGLSYYIPRSIRSRFVLNKEVIFGKETKDIFLFTGIKPHELSSRVGDHSVDKSGSQVRQMSLSVNHILLENKAHFKTICELAKETAVHWLEYQNGKFVWVKSGCGNISTIQKAAEGMTEENEVFGETDFLAHLNLRAKAHGISPVVIADSPGMGKSILLHNLARQILKNSGRKKAVNYVVISELILQLHQMKKKWEKLTICHVDAALTQLTTSAGDKDWSNLLKTTTSNLQSEVEIELMLDDYDEILLADMPLAREFLSLVQNSYPSVRIWIASTPHLLPKLENELHVTGYTLLPFTKSNQEQYLTLFWHSKICTNETCQLAIDNKCTSVDLNLVAKVAKHCLKTLKSTCSKDSEDEEICGVPLQCRMLAEVFKEDCLNFVNKENWTSDEEPTLSLRLTSIKDLYESLIEVKLNKFVERYSKELRPEMKVESLLRHVHLALQLLFPSNSILVQTKLHVWVSGTGSTNVLDDADILSVGILESLGCSRTPPRFIHRTVAEFLVARFFAETLSMEKKPGSLDTFQTSGSTPGFQLSTQYLTALSADISSTIDSKLEFMQRGKIPITITTQVFVNEVIVLFLNFLLDLEGLTPKDNERPWVISNTYAITASIHHDHFKVFRILVNSGGAITPTLHSKVNILRVGVRRASLNFVKALFEIFGESEDALTLVEKSLLLKCAAEFREYCIVDFLLNAQGLNRIVQNFDPLIRDLAHDLLYESAHQPMLLIKEKMVVLERLAHLQPKLLDWKSEFTMPLFLAPIHVELLLKLIELGANPVFRRNDGATLLHAYAYLSGQEYHRVVACLSEKENALPMLVNQDMPRFGNCPIHHIAELIILPEKSTLECMLRHGADFGVTDLYGRKCLHVAVWCGNIGAARVLLQFDQGRKIVSEKDGIGETPLYSLVTLPARRRLPVLQEEEFGRVLMDGGATLSGDLILHRIFSEDNLPDTERVRFLIEVCKADVNLQDENKNTPLHVYLKNWSKERRVDVVKTLLDNGADVNALNMINWTPLQFLLISTSSEMIDGSCLEILVLLEEYGAMKNSPELAHEALLLAVTGKSSKMYDKFKKLAEKLIKAGARVEKVSAWECARGGWNHGLRYLLEKNMVNPNERNKEGKTVLQLYMASVKPAAEVFELLLQNEAVVGR